MESETPKTPRVLLIATFMAIAALMLVEMNHPLLTPPAHGGIGTAAIAHLAMMPGSAVVVTEVQGLGVRTDVDGHPLDAHDGTIRQFGDTFYLYGTAYACGFGWGQKGTPWCGFRTYSSNDLRHWVDRGLLFDPASFQTVCGGSSFGCYRPQVVLNARTGRYVLWWNGYDVASGYHVFTAASPVGPFTEEAQPRLLTTPAKAGLNEGDEYLFVDEDGAAYLAHTVIPVNNHDIFIERLSADYLTGAGQSVDLGLGGVEAPVLFKSGATYHLLYSDPFCAYCSGTGTGHMVAASPLGPWTRLGRLSEDSCHGQPTGVAAITTADGPQFIYLSDQWLGTPNEAKAGQAWQLLGSGPMTCASSFEVRLLTATARHGELT